MKYIFPLLLIPFFSYSVLVPESKILRKGLEDAGKVATVTLVTGIGLNADKLVVAGKDLSDTVKDSGIVVGDSLKAGAIAMGDSLKGSADVIAITAGIGIAVYLGTKLQPYVWPTHQQRLEKEAAKIELDVVKSRSSFQSCIFKNIKDHDKELGFPKVCSPEAQLFAIKAGNARYEDMINAIKKTT